jgi:hypothetical protein
MPCAPEGATGVWMNEWMDEWMIVTLKQMKCGIIEEINAKLKYIQVTVSDSGLSCVDNISYYQWRFKVIWLCLVGTNEPYTDILLDIVAKRLSLLLLIL